MYHADDLGSSTLEHAAPKVVLGQRIDGADDGSGPIEMGIHCVGDFDWWRRGGGSDGFSAAGATTRLLAVASATSRAPPLHRCNQ